MEGPIFRNKKRVYRWRAPALISNLASSTRGSVNIGLIDMTTNPDGTVNNTINVVRLKSDDCEQELEHVASTNQEYPITKVLWAPVSKLVNSSQPINMFATTSDSLRIWNLIEDDCDKYIKELHTFVPGDTLKNPPLTSFDWNDVDPGMIITSSVDATCTIWDVRIGEVCVSTPSSISSKPKESIITNDREVFDVSFTRLASGREVFTSVGGDSTLRVFDLRQLSSFVGIFKNSSNCPLVRVECNKLDPNLLATFALSSNEIIIIDLRWPSKSLVTLMNHRSQINGISWSPSSSNHLSSCSEDHQALIWDLCKLPESTKEPVLAYKATSPINAINWCQSNPDFVSIGHANNLELLRV